MVLGGPELPTPLTTLAREPLSASEAGQTLLRVHLAGDAQDWQAAGALTCVSSEGFSPEVDRAPVVEVLRAEPSRRDYEFVLPAARHGAVVTASLPGLPPAQACLYDLRVEGDDWAAKDAQLVRDVVIELGAEPREPFLGGDIRVDGGTDLPADLEIVLRQSVRELTTWKQLYLGGDRHALIWKERASYRIWPLTDHAQGLWITSKDLVPCWIPLQVEGAGDRKLDLELSRGGHVRLAVVERASGRPLPFLSLRVERQVRTATSADRGEIVYRQSDLVTRTDASGECEIGGLASDGYLRVVVRPGEPQETEAIGMHLDGRPLAGEVVSVEVAGTDDFAAVAGDLDPASLETGSPSCLLGPVGGEVDAPVLVAVRSIGAQASPLRFVPLEGLSWSFGAAPGSYELWSERGGQRISAVTRLSLAAGDHAGPIHLGPAQRTDSLELRWPMVPPHVTRSVTVRDRSPGGQRVLQSGNLLASAGACRLPLPAADEEAGPGGSYVLELLQVEFPDCQAGVVVDLAEAQSVDLGALLGPVREFRLGGLECAGESLDLYRLDRDGPRALVALTLSGEGLTRGSLPAGSYYYRVRGRPEWALCGVVEVPDGLAHVDVPWDARWTERPILSQDAGSLEVEEIDGRALTVVPRELRVFALPERGAVLLSGGLRTQESPGGL